VIWLDRAVLRGLDRAHRPVLRGRGAGFLQMFDESLASARGHQGSTGRRTAIHDDRSPLPDLTQMLVGMYLVLAAVLSVVALFVLPDAGAPHSAWWSAPAAVVISLPLGQAVWHGVVNSVRLRAGRGDGWSGTVTDAPVAALLLDAVLAVALWAVLR
jgi:hypothetical protein